jgi:hypothetical protein
MVLSSQWVSYWRSWSSIQPPGLVALGGRRLVKVGIEGMGLNLRVCRF